MYSEVTESRPTFRDFVQLPLAMFETVGLFVFRFEKERRKYNCLDRFHLTLALIQIIWNISCLVAYLFCGQFDSAIEITTLALYWTFAISSSIKGAWMFYIRHDMRVLFWMFIREFPNSSLECETFKLQENYLKIKKYNRALFTFHMITTTMFNIFPFIQSIGAYLLNDDEEFPYLLPYMMSYPFDVHTFWGYLSAYIIQCMGAYTCSCFYLGTDLLTLTLVHIVNMHLNYLQQEIIIFRPTGSDMDLATLRRLLLLHQKLYVCSTKMDEVLGLSNLINYIACTIMICLIAIQIVLGSHVWDLLKFLCFLIATLVQVFFISVFATTMLDMSIGVGDAFFEQRWFLTNIKYQHMLKFVISRTQRPITLRALNCFTISTESFKTLMSTSYQFFTLIKSSLDQNT